METGKILLTWTYLQVRLHLYDLKVTYDDFDPMENFEECLEIKTGQSSNLNLLLKEMQTQDSKDSKKTCTRPVDRTVTKKKPPLSNSEKENVKEPDRNEFASIFDDDFEAGPLTEMMDFVESEEVAQKNEAPSGFYSELDAFLSDGRTSPIIKRKRIHVSSNKAVQESGSGYDEMESSTSQTVKPIANESTSSSSVLLKRKAKSNLPPWLKKPIK